MLLGDCDARPHRLFYSLSPQIHSQQYAAVATLTCGEASQGPLFIV